MGGFAVTVNSCEGITLDEGAMQQGRLQQEQEQRPETRCADQLRVIS